VIGTVGEPINEEAWHWYDENIGKKNCPIVDTWWQTETGGCLISNLAGITPSRPGWATLPMPGVQPILVDENGNEIAPSIPQGGSVQTPLLLKQDANTNTTTSKGEVSAVDNPSLGGGEAGNLCIKAPWPAILRTTYNDHERCRQTYFSTYENLYFTGDG
ncbi:MAG: AMP-binding protein, partial [Chitinophagaceae bacterium]